MAPASTQDLRFLFIAKQPHAQGTLRVDSTPLHAYLVRSLMKNVNLSFIDVKSGIAGIKQDNDLIIASYR
jgi:hypothetical protein